MTTLSAEKLTPRMRDALKDADRGALWRVRTGWLPLPGGNMAKGPFHAQGTVKALEDRGLMTVRFNDARLTQAGQELLAKMEEADA
jgi:hypothetical protein